MLLRGTSSFCNPVFLFWLCMPAPILYPFLKVFPLTLNYLFMSWIRRFVIHCKKPVEQSEQKNGRERVMNKEKVT